MKILLLGEYSNVHWGLAEGLRSLGHTVCVVSNGDYWKNYRRDISLVRNRQSRWGGVAYTARLLSLLPRLRGYDVVQLINPLFLDLKAERILPVYRYLRRHNGKVFMAAFGMDHYWVSGCTAMPRLFRYSDFNVGDAPLDNEVTRAEIADWMGTAKERLNRAIANDCDGIVAGMYEYLACYRPHFGDKVRYIPFPIDTSAIEPIDSGVGDRVRIFIGIQKSRSLYKGTDVMLRALERVAQRYPQLCTVNRAESVPYDEYRRLIRGSDLLIDQLYGYSPGMNALLAMASGQVVVGGGEPECYQLLSEEELRPMLCVQPSEEDVVRQLEWAVLHRDELPRLKRESRLFVERHHNPQKVARSYLCFWEGRNG